MRRQMSRTEYLLHKALEMQSQFNERAEKTGEKSAFNDLADLQVEVIKHQQRLEKEIAELKASLKNPKV